MAFDPARQPLEQEPAQRPLILSHIRPVLLRSMHPGLPMLVKIEFGFRMGGQLAKVVWRPLIYDAQETNFLSCLIS